MQTQSTIRQIDQWRDHRSSKPRGLTVSYLSIYRGLIFAAAILCLFRGTQMWFGYPTSQGEFSNSSDQLRGQLFVYTITALVTLALCIRPAPLLNKLANCGLLLGATYAFVIASVVFSQDKVASLRGLFAALALSLPMVLFYFEFGAVTTRKLLYWFALVTVLANVAYTVAFPRYAFMSGSLAGDLRGLFGHKNLFGQCMAVFFAMFLTSASAPLVSSRRRLIDVGLCVITAGMVVASHSSTAMAQLPIGIAVLFAVRTFQLFREKSLRQLVIFLFFIALVWSIFLIGTYAVSAFTANVGKDMTFSGRTLIWGALLPHVFDHPFTGHGFALFRNPVHIKQYTDVLSWNVLSTHNSYLELALNIGVPGTIIWVSFIFARLFAKLSNNPATAALRAARDQEVTIITMIVIGAMTEAGSMMAPLALWPLLVASLPMAGSSTTTTEKRVRRGVRRPG